MVVDHPAGGAASEATSHAEPGCEGFTAHRASEDPREFVLFEYHKAAFDAHVESVHSLEIARDRIRPMLDSRDVRLYGDALET